jgi:hypothetical protein
MQMIHFIGPRMESEIFRSAGCAKSSFCALLVGTLIGLCTGALAHADIIPPRQLATTPGGINIADGSLQFSVTDLTIGTLKLVRFHRTGSGTAKPNDPPFGNNFSYNFDTYVGYRSSSTSPTHRTVHIGNGASGSYGYYSATTILPENTDSEKGMLSMSGSQYVYLDNSDGAGTIYTFSATVTVAGALGGANSRRVERIDFADGRRQTFSYNGSGYLKLVEDTAGYAIVFDYNANGDVTAACAFNRSQTYVSASSTCASATMKTTYAYSGTDLISVTDVMGQVTNYTMGPRGMTCIKPPGYSACTMSMVYTGNRVSSQTLQDGGTWGTWGLSPEVINNPDADYGAGCNDTSMTDPNGVTTYQAFTSTSPCWITDALAYTTNFSFDGGATDPFAPAQNYGSFLKQATYPGGNTYQAEYLGPFRAISKEIMISKPGSPLANLVKQYGYQTSCTTPPATYQNCAKPIWIKDPKGNQTDFTYASHGGLLTEMKPAPTGGAPRPLKINTYVQKYAYVKNSSGSLVQAATPIWMLNTETQCQTAAGSSTPTCDPGGPQVVTTYQYGANGTADNLLVRGVAVSADGQTRRTCFGYDVWARKISETKPNAGLSVCP